MILELVHFDSVLLYEMNQDQASRIQAENRSYEMLRASCEGCSCKDVKLLSVHDTCPFWNSALERA